MEKKQTVKPEQTTESPVVEETSTSDIGEEASASSKVLGVDRTAEDLIQHKFNELRREHLDYRANSINWWLRVVGIVLTIFALVIPFVGYFAYQRFENLESQAEEHVNEAEKYANTAGEYLKKIRVHETTAGEILSKLTSEDADKPETTEKVRKAIEEIEQNPKSSLEDKVRAKAYGLQGLGKITEAIERWQSIADFAKGTDKGVAADAWFSIGYLYQKDSEDKKALSAYDKAILLKPDYAKAYNNRGVLKKRFRRFEDAIKDYNEAIRLDPDNVAGYYNRANARSSLNQHELAFEDYDKAIELKPDYAKAYSSRGQAKLALNQYESALEDIEKAIQIEPDLAYAYNNRARVKSAQGDIKGAVLDFHIALELAEQQGEEELKVYVAKQIQKLNSIE